MTKKILLEIVIKTGIILPEQLQNLIEEVNKIIDYEKNNYEIILSGRMPVWAYAALVHSLHPCRWVGTFEPRNNCGIIVESHVKEVKIGDKVDIKDKDFEKITIEI